MLTNTTFSMIIDDFVQLTRDHFETSLKGIYLHGSAAMGCFNPTSSDLDLLVVIDSDQPLNHLKLYQRRLTDLENLHGFIGIEMSLLQDSDLKANAHPMPFIYHFSKKYRGLLENELDQICHHGVDYDLAAHLTVTRHRGICLFGTPIVDVIPTVPKSHFMDSLLRDIDCDGNDFLATPVYHILNLCRTLQFLMTKMVGSKLEGGEWALTFLETNHHPVVKWAMDCYQSNVKDSILTIEPDDLLSFRTLLLSTIQPLSQVYDDK